MPLVYEEAKKRYLSIASDSLLKQLEIQGFAKCVARKSCLDDIPQDMKIQTLVTSLCKQLSDFNEAVDRDDKLEALADLRNVAGLLFLALHI